MTFKTLSSILWRIACIYRYDIACIYRYDICISGINVIKTDWSPLRVYCGLSDGGRSDAEALHHLFSHIECALELSSWLKYSFNSQLPLSMRNSHSPLQPLQICIHSRERSSKQKSHWSRCQGTACFSRQAWIPHARCLPCLPLPQQSISKLYSRANLFRSSIFRTVASCSQLATVLYWLDFATLCALVDLQTVQTNGLIQTLAIVAIFADTLDQ